MALRDRSTSLTPTSTTEGAATSRARVHNFSISLDGFATGEGQAADAPFGHAGHRLHEWMFATRFWNDLGLVEPGGDAAGTAGADNAFAERYERHIGAEIMVAVSGCGMAWRGWSSSTTWRRCRRGAASPISPSPAEGRVRRRWEPVHRSRSRSHHL